MKVYSDPSLLCLCGNLLASLPTHELFPRVERIILRHTHVYVPTFGMKYAATVCSLYVLAFNILSDCKTRAWSEINISHSHFKKMSNITNHWRNKNQKCSEIFFLPSKMATINITPENNKCCQREWRNWNSCVLLMTI